MDGKEKSYGQLREHLVCQCELLHTTVDLLLLLHFYQCNIIDIFGHYM